MSTAYINGSTRAHVAHWRPGRQDRADWISLCGTVVVGWLDVQHTDIHGLPALPWCAWCATRVRRLARDVLGTEVAFSPYDDDPSVDIGGH